MQSNHIFTGICTFILFFFFSLGLNGQIVQDDWNKARIFSKYKELHWLESDFNISKQYLDPQTNFRHIYIQQVLKGLPIVGKVGSLHFDKNEELVHCNQNFVSLEAYEVQDSNGWLPTALLEQKLIETKNDLQSELNNCIHQEDELKSGTRSKKPDDFQFNKVFIADSLNKRLIPGYRVFWKRKENAQWLDLVINAKTGEVIEEFDMIKSCSFENFRFTGKRRFQLQDHHSPLLNTNCYRVFPMPVESPIHGSRDLVMGPWTKAVNASPFGWHGDGLNFYYSTRGNNIDAFEDSDDDDLPTGGDAARAVGGFNLNFDFPYDPVLPLSANKDASITNLFYWTNLMHDIWYQYGFHELAGNFQMNNFNRGGVGNDPIIAQGFDNIYYARNNANFGTAADGNSGILQMYLWNAPVFDTLIIESPAQIAGKYPYIHSPITPPLFAPLMRQIVLVQDASTYPSFACSNLTNANQLYGKIAMVDKGICSFYSKMQRIQASGAVGVLICNNDDAGVSGIGGWSYGMSIPAVMMKKSDCDRIKIYLNQGVIGTMLPSINYKFSIGAKQYIFSRAYFGSTIQNRQGAVVQVIDNGGNGFDGCDQIINGSSLYGNIALFDEENCEPSYKALQAQNLGAIAAIICKQGSGYPEPIPSGTYGQLVRIPVIGLSASDCQQIRLTLPKIGQFKNETPPLIDGDFDAGIVCHEYGHGISMRLTGGGNNIGCLNNAEQMGEGWSDFFGLVMTIQPTDYAFKARGIGNFAAGLTNVSNGLRPYPYHVSLGINPAHYSQLGDLVNISQPHGIGYIWCSMLWDMFWALVKQHGFEPDFYNASSNAGNVKAFRLIVEAMKLQPCYPGFVDARNAILAADNLLYGGENYCLLWNVFARRGLGYYANQGSTDRRDDGTADQSLPSSCFYMDEQQLFGSGTLSTEEIQLYAGSDPHSIELVWKRISQQNIAQAWLIRKVEHSEATTKIELSLQEFHQQRYADTDVVPNQNYFYQLEVAMRSGKTEHSNWVKARMTDHSDGWSIYPVPASDHVIVRSKQPDASAYSILLMDANLQEIDQFKTEVKRKEEVKINCDDLQPGVYFLIIKSDQGQHILKFVKN